MDLKNALLKNLQNLLLVIQTGSSKERKEAFSQMALFVPRNAFAYVSLACEADSNTIRQMAVEMIDADYSLAQIIHRNMVEEKLTVASKASEKVDFFLFKQLAMEVADKPFMSILARYRAAVIVGMSKYPQLHESFFMSTGLEDEQRACAVMYLEHELIFSLLGSGFINIEKIGFRTADAIKLVCEADNRYVEQCVVLHRYVNKILTLDDVKLLDPEDSFMRKVLYGILFEHTYNKFGYNTTLTAFKKMLPYLTRSEIKELLDSEETIKWIDLSLAYIQKAEWDKDSKWIIMDLTSSTDTNVARAAISRIPADDIEGQQLLYGICLNGPDELRYDALVKIDWDENTKHLYKEILLNLPEDLNVASLCAKHILDRSLPEFTDEELLQLCHSTCYAVKLYALRRVNPRIAEARSHMLAMLEVNQGNVGHKLPILENINEMELNHLSLYFTGEEYKRLGQDIQDIIVGVYHSTTEMKKIALNIYRNICRLV